MSNQKILTCKRGGNGCGARIRFDKNITSERGIMIPLDYNTGEPHQCPNSDYNKRRSEEEEQYDKYKPAGKSNSYEEKQKWWADRDAKLDERWEISQGQIIEQIGILKDILSTLQKIANSNSTVISASDADNYKQQKTEEAKAIEKRKEETEQASKYQI